MNNITINDIKKLRKLTGIGILECKNSLIKTKGNIKLAINLMRTYGKKISIKKTNNKTSYGIILIKKSEKKKILVMLEIKCETDFVSKNIKFKSFGKEIINYVLNKNIYDINLINIKFKLKREYLISKICENIKIEKLSYLKGESTGFYLHRSRIGVIISSTKFKTNFLNKIAMHIVACKPKYINSIDIPKNLLNDEQNIQMEIAITSGKTYKISKKIVTGRMNKFIQEITLNNQEFIIDNKKTINQILSLNKTKINNFILFEI
ncbi:MAG: translation elongation factor Ts [Candidatus Makana argininalis]